LPPKINTENCNACGHCADVCSEDVFYGSQTQKTPVVTYPAECWHCGACAVECPRNAICFYIPLYMRVAGKNGRT
jgi:adenylylsulfate reductase subunit B